MIKQRQYRHTNEAGLSYWTATTLVAAAFLSLTLVGCAKKSESKSVGQTTPTQTQPKKDSDPIPEVKTGADNSANPTKAITQNPQHPQEPQPTTLVETASTSDSANPPAKKSDPQVDKIGEAFAELERAGYEVIYHPETGAKPAIVPTHKILLNTDDEALQALHNTVKALESAQFEAGFDTGWKLGSASAVTPKKDLVAALNQEIVRYQDRNYLTSVKREQLERHDGLTKNLQPIGLQATKESPNGDWTVVVTDERASETGRKSGESHNVLARLSQNLPSTDSTEPLRVALNSELQKTPEAPPAAGATVPVTADETATLTATGLDGQFQELAKDAQSLAERIAALQQASAQQRQELTEELKTRDQIIEEAAEALDRANDASALARQALSRARKARQPAQQPAPQTTPKQP